MTLSKFEKVILMNQYDILEKLSKDKDTKKWYSEKREVIKKGYPLELDSIFDSMEEPKSENDCREVRDILSMFNDIQYSYTNLKGNINITKDEITFKGFDINFEEVQYGYAVFRLEKDDKFVPIKHPDLNSHESMLNRYRKMHSIWKNIPNREPGNLDENQIRQILSAI